MCKLFRLLTILVLTAGLLAGLGGCGGTPVPPTEMILATTTSTADSGLLDAILPAFEAKYNAKVKVVAVGSGQAFQMGQSGDADVLLVHDRAGEDNFVADGYGTARYDVMYNDFILVGPPGDPAGIRGTTTGKEALAKIASAQAPFASRGDDSGTNRKELKLWKSAAITPTGDWYLSLGQGMGDTLTFANEKGAYTISDRGTFLSMKDKLPNLEILVGGNAIAENKDPALLNPYGVIPVNPAKFPNVKADLANKFAEWITSVETQKTIGEYGASKYGQPLFHASSDAWKKANP